MVLEFFAVIEQYVKMPYKMKPTLANNNVNSATCAVECFQGMMCDAISANAIPIRTGNTAFSSFMLFLQLTRGGQLSAASYLEDESRSV